jgi:hypothetical protein
MAARVGFSATISREPRQARKGATVTVISGAGEAPARAVSKPASYLREISFALNDLR